MKTVRTRFAVSPTGYMHVGGVRSALFDWLVARHHKGAFVLRIEDTDQVRQVEGAVDHIIETLQWLGLAWDEGPDIGGPHAPYTQSERLTTYREWGQKLVDKGRAYADPYSQDELQSLREQAQREKKPFLYRDHRPEKPPVWDGSQPLRFKSDPKPYTWHDEVMGKLSTGPEAVDDFILIKSDGYATYNFCHIVDDELMAISHVIRGPEFLPSVPKYLNLYEALDLQPPIFATVPWIMASEGNKKLSKRDGAKDVMTYAKEGFLPEVMINFLASLGWNDGTTQELFTVDELIEKFSLDRVQRSGARFDEQRLIWMNGARIRELDLDDLFEKVQAFWPPEAANQDDAFKKQVLSLVQERLKYFAELSELTRFFFTDLPVNPELISSHKQLKKYEPTQLKALLQTARDSLANSDFSANDLNQRLNQLLEETGEKPAVLFSLIRIATTQAPASPGLADTLHVLGKGTSLRRIDSQIAAL